VDLKCVAPILGEISYFLFIAFKCICQHQYPMLSVRPDMAGLGMLLRNSRFGNGCLLTYRSLKEVPVLY